MDGNIIYKTHTIIRNVAIFVSVIIFYGCSQNRTNLLPSNIITSDSIYFSESTDILSQDIIDSIYWIPLDSSHINIFDHISKMCVVNDYIYSLLAEINLLFKYIQRKEIFFIKYQIKEMGQKIILK